MDIHSKALIRGIVENCIQTSVSSILWYRHEQNLGAEGLFVIPKPGLWDFSVGAEA